MVYAFKIERKKKNEKYIPNNNYIAVHRSSDDRFFYEKLCKKCVLFVFCASEHNNGPDVKKGRKKMVKINLDRKLPELTDIELEGKYIDLLTEMTWLTIFFAERAENKQAGRTAEAVLTTMYETAKNYVKEVE